MIFLIGYKSNYYRPKMVKFITRQDIDKINMIEISYMFLILNHIPSKD